MKNFPYISVVIPAYNERDYLEISLSSLANQSYPHDRYEVIVVDNASTDSTARIAQEWGAIVVEEPCKGVARARQTGFLAARGNIIASTDADTAVSPDWLARIDRIFRTGHYTGGVYGPVYWPDGKPLERWMLQYPVTSMLALSNRFGRSLWWGSNFAIRREVFLSVGGFSTDMPAGEDTDLSLRVNRYYNIRYDPDLVAYSSPRRMRRGYVRYTYDFAQHVVQRFILYSTLPPMMDIR